MPLSRRGPSYVKNRGPSMSPGQDWMFRGIDTVSNGLYSRQMDRWADGAEYLNGELPRIRVWTGVQAGVEAFGIRRLKVFPSPPLATPGSPST